MKIKRIERDGDHFVMTVGLEGKNKEKWVYERVETSDSLVSYILVGRE
jgi:hypothetical protein